MLSVYPKALRTAMGFLGEAFGLWGLGFGIAVSGSKSLRVRAVKLRDVQGVWGFGFQACRVEGL